MDAQERRRGILRCLEGSAAPVSAAVLASRFNVSRQVVVGDVALLRASGEDISATPRGYVLSRDTDFIKRTVACCHGPEDMERELNIIVDNGCTVLDVIVEHPIYGQLAGRLELKSRYDVRQFALRSQQEEARPLSDLTDGIHLHTILCPDEDAFQRVKEDLRQAGLLLQEEA